MMKFSTRSAGRCHQETAAAINSRYYKFTFTLTSKFQLLYTLIWVHRLLAAMLNLLLCAQLLGAGLLLFGDANFFACAASIEDFGAIDGPESWDVASQNSDAFLKALTAANESSTDRTILFPANKTYFLINNNFDGFKDVEIQVSGIAKFIDEIMSYPTEDEFHLWWFTNCENIKITGDGTLDGQGLKWWRYTYTGTDNRPRFIRFETTRGIIIEGITLLDSPSWTIDIRDSADVVVHDITIFIDSSVTRVRDRDSVTYALNTDGIDVAVENALIYNNVITNYDDAIVAKPCKSTGTYCKCSSNILAYNNSITYSTGLTIGSVPPNENTNCVRNVTFRDSTMFRPLKAIYIKPNPGR